jgi:hypothetical protein
MDFSIKVPPITIFTSLKDVLPAMTWPYTVLLIGCKPLDLLSAQPVASTRQVSPTQSSTLRIFTGNSTGGPAAAVAIPAGALAALTALTSKMFKAFALPAAAVFAAAAASYAAAGPAVLLLPHGTSFSKPVGVSLQIPADLAARIGTTVSCSGSENQVSSGTIRRAVVVLRKSDDAAATPWVELPGVDCEAASASQVRFWTPPLAFPLCLALETVFFNVFDVPMLSACQSHMSVCLSVSEFFCQRLYHCRDCPPNQTFRCRFMSIPRPHHFQQTVATHAFSLFPIESAGRGCNC